jgi:hypothetical protein
MADDDDDDNDNNDVDFKTDWRSGDHDRRPNQIKTAAAAMQTTTRTSARLYVVTAATYFAKRIL